MNPYPYMRYFVSDFENDQHVAVMSTLALGAYHRLLWRAWHQSPVGTLPHDDELLAHWARLTAAEWAAVKAEVGPCFKLVRLAGGTRLQQKRMVNEYAAIRTATKEASKKGRTAAEGRWGTKKFPARKLIPSKMMDACALPMHCPGNAISETDTENNNTATGPPPEPPGDVVVVEPAAGIPDPDPVAAGLLRGTGVSDAVADDLARTTPAARVSELIEAGKRRVGRGSIKPDQLAGFVVTGIREGFVVQGVERVPGPPDERVRSAVSGAERAKAERLAEERRLAEAKLTEVARLAALPPGRLAELKAAVLAEADEFNRGRLEKADPLTNPTLRSLMVQRMAAAG